jgi:hypothetical protein
MKKRKDILHSDSRGVIPTAKGYRLLDAGFFYQMNIVENTNRTAEQEAEASWELEDRIFRPLTSEAVTRQLREMQARWYNRRDREFDLEDEYEEWMMAALIAAIEEGSLTLNSGDSKPTMLQIPSDMAKRLEKLTHEDETLETMCLGVLQGFIESQD